MSEEELKLVFERPFTSEEIEYFNKTTIETVRKLLENSINHSNEIDIKIVSKHKLKIDPKIDPKAVANVVPKIVSKIDPQN